MTQRKTFHSRSGIKATVIAHSKASTTGVELVTFELEFPRYCLAEINTHCMLEKNSASSRAIPVESMLALIESAPAMPVEWGANNPGMSSKSLLDDERRDAAIMTWLSAMKQAVAHARILADKEGINAHKQLANRVTETWQMSKTVITGTEWANFFWLRDHPDAQPEFQELARTMHAALHDSIPDVLTPGQWHLPYITRVGDTYYTGDNEVDLETAKKISASCCAQVSYRKLNDSVEQAEKVFGMLNLGSSTQPAHASPITHQATPMQQLSYENYVNIPHIFDTWERGVTHVRRNKSMWSGKLQGWIQYRQLFDNEAKW